MGDPIRHSLTFGEFLPIEIGGWGLFLFPQPGHLPIAPLCLFFKVLRPTAFSPLFTRRFFFFLCGGGP